MSMQVRTAVVRHVHGAVDDLGRAAFSAVEGEVPAAAAAVAAVQPRRTAERRVQSRGGGVFRNVTCLKERERKKKV